MKLPPLGAHYTADGRCSFCVWAPYYDSVKLRIIEPEEKEYRLTPMADGYHCGAFQDINPSTLYFYRLGDHDFPDPASKRQPHGVHGPSALFPTDGMHAERTWFGVPLHDYIIYELHIGTFTQAGTFESAISYLDELRDLGITAIEIMPIASFPGDRNWGYDGVFPFSVQESYGGPSGLMNFVNACHERQMAVLLDVVYNHLGPEGNYLRNFGPYFTELYKTPWGDAINFDGPHSDSVRHFFIENALYWIRDFHIDGLRLDAVHGIFDFSAYHILKELNDQVQESALKAGRMVHVIAESDLNDNRLVTPSSLGGYGLAGQWSDDFHHAVHALITGEDSGYYMDFGSVRHLVKAFREGFVYSGIYSVHRNRRHGNGSLGIHGSQLVVFSQNHDQVGNRMVGDRLASLVPEEALYAAAGVVLLSPYIPLLFMGEEYGETAPFTYFVSHSDEQLVEAVREGRKNEFSHFIREGEIPDPQETTTFTSVKLNHDLKRQGFHKSLFQFYKKCIELRKTLPVLSNLCKDSMAVTGYEHERILVVRRWLDEDEVVLFFGFNSEEFTIHYPFPSAVWLKILDSYDYRSDSESNLPIKIEANAEMSLNLRPYQIIVYVRERN